MITLDQIKELDIKVQKALNLISSLREENNSLKAKLGKYQKRIEEMETLITEFKNDQDEIEQGIMNALAKLDQLEEDITIDEASEEKETEEPEETEEEIEEPEKQDGSTSELDIF